MPKIRIKFVDFWPGFKPEDNYFYHLLTTRYQVVLSDHPEFVICSLFGQAFRDYACTRIVFIGENRRPDFSLYDYAFSFDHLDHERHYRFPLYGFYLGLHPEQLVRKALDAEQLLKGKTRFCNFVYSNPDAQRRIAFLKKLTQYKTVDSGGKVLNNLGHLVEDKISFLAQYKFTIAFENASFPGYTTEKMHEPLLVRSVPIYWGNPLVHLDFNPKSFVNCHDYPDDEAVIEQVIKLDRDRDLYLQCLREPCYHGNHVSECLRPENVLRQFERIFNAPQPSLGTRCLRLLRRSRRPNGDRC